MINKTIRQFKGVITEDKNITKKTPTIETTLLIENLKNGFIFSNKILRSNHDLKQLTATVKKELNLTPKELNNSLHKSWNKITTASDEQLIIEQLIHYMTTYGFEKLGIYSDDTVYIPHEKLDIPGLNKNIKLTIIKDYTREEIKEKALNLLSTGIALKEETMNDMVDILGQTGFTDEDIEKIKNKETKIIFCDLTGTIPENPTEFMRLLIYKKTGKTLIIKSHGVIEQIKESDINTGLLFSLYKSKYRLKNLAQSFNRYKPLYLAMKNNDTKSYINKIRKLSKKHHKPMKEDYLNNVTSFLKKGVAINVHELKEELSKANVFRKIRLAYALKYRTKDTDSIMYKIRNGKGWAKEFKSNIKSGAKIALMYVFKSICDDIKKNVEGKVIYIPENIHYALPATEKQFTGNFPSGTYINVDEDMIVGVNWKNIDNYCVDLDLKMVGLCDVIGWDYSYRTAQRDVLFSGDITSAPGPNGATELFYIRKQPSKPFLLTLNYYNYNEDVDVPFKLLVAKEKTTNFTGNYMVDPNNVLSVTTDIMSERQSTLGLLVPSNNGTKFIYCKTNIGSGRSSSINNMTRNINNYLFNFYNNTIELEDVLLSAGAVIVREKSEDGLVDIDLSPEVLEKDTIINLLTR